MRKYSLILIVPLLLILWWGLSRRDSEPVVHFVKVGLHTIESTVPTNGKVEPVEWAAARAEIPGVVKSVGIQRGQEVKAGQVLITLDTTAAQSDLATALAREQEARSELHMLAQGGKAATLASIEDSIKSAQAAVESAQRNYNSLQRLLASQAATKLQVLQAKDALEKAKLQLSAAQNQRKNLVTASDREVAEAKLRDAQAAVQLAQHQLDLSKIKAPISGTVYQFDLKVGAYLQPGGLVAYVGNLDQVKVTVYVDEPELGRVSKGMKVHITWGGQPGRDWWGEVDKLPSEVIALGTRTVGEVSTIVNNPNHDLLPGVTVDATIISKIAKNTLSIPKAALRTLGGATGVFKLNGRSVTWTPVKTGVSDINNVQIVSGLHTGDSVMDRVIDPSDAEIRNGMRVRPTFE